MVVVVEQVVIENLIVNPCTSGCYSASPLATPTSLPVSVTTYPITVGGGGAPSPCKARKLMDQIQFFQQ
jgi:hypothetical protein